jgi:hypothetical protein
LALNVEEVGSETFRRSSPLRCEMRLGERRRG